VGICCCSKNNGGYLLLFRWVVPARDRGGLTSADARPGGLFRWYLLLFVAVPAPLGTANRGLNSLP
jgi:hypothetical protein